MTTTPDPPERAGLALSLEEFAAAHDTGRVHALWVAFSAAACALLALPLSIWALPGTCKVVLWAAVALAGIVTLVNVALCERASRRAADAVSRL